MRRVAFGAVGIAAALAIVVGCKGQPTVQSAGRATAVSLPFEAKFETASDFYDRFDYGFSGINPLSYGDGIRSYHGDHDMTCGGPTTDRTVNLTGSNEPRGALDFSQVLWYCAPGGDGAKGHIMTGVDTKGYNTAWFSPKPYFTNVSKVCWDINETALSRRKWTQVMFISPADAIRYRAGTPTMSGGVQSIARGSGGFDLGYTSPSFREDDPNNGIFPQAGDMAGLVDFDTSSSWFQNQDTFTTYEEKSPPAELTTDKAARFKHCLEQTGPNEITYTFDAPVSQDNSTQTVSRTLTGTIPQGPVRIVFEDDNYNPGKDDRYSPTTITWHWDNIHIEAGAAAVVAKP